MKIHDIGQIRAQLSTRSGRANESLGSYDASTLGIGRYLPGASPWERHTNGDELLYVTDGDVSVEVLQADGTSATFHLSEGQLLVVPRGQWHQLTATAHVNILFASPPEDGAERTRDRPFAKR